MSFRACSKVFIVCLMLLLLSISAFGGTTERVSISTSGAQANIFNNNPAATGYYTSISADGRYVVFDSDASDLVPSDNNGKSDIFIRDLVDGTTELVSLSNTGGQGDDRSADPCLSDDGKIVVFRSYATNLVAGDTNGIMDVFVRDLVNGTTERVNVSSTGIQSNDIIDGPVDISADGRYIAFASAATNLVTDDTNARTDVFVRDRLTGTTERVSISSTSIQGNDASGYMPCISADGRYIAFGSDATNFMVDDYNRASDVFIRDRLMNTLELISVSSEGYHGNGFSMAPSVTKDGRYVAFQSEAFNLVAGGGTARTDCFLRDRLMGTTERVSVSSSGELGNGYNRYPRISEDGKYIVFISDSSNLVTGDTNGKNDIFVRNRIPSTTELISVSTSGELGNDDSGLNAISADGGRIVFASRSTNLVPGDTNGQVDTFMR
ncbi:MAG: TolB family protein, partial [Armatimonadota bacterium]